MSTPVKSGIDAVVTQNGALIGWATEVTFDEDFMLEAINTLGKHGPRGFKSLNYDANMSVGTFILDPELEDGTPVADNLQTATRRSILSIGDFTFELFDLIRQDVFIKALGCVPSQNTWTMSAGQLATKQTQWKCTEIVSVNVR